MQQQHHAHSLPVKNAQLHAGVHAIDQKVQNRRLDRSIGQCVHLLVVLL
jgi:hypothetical protein